MDTLKYWCEGSEEKLLQLVMAQINQFDLREEVADQLRVTLSKEEQKVAETRALIVERAADALAILKECRTETQCLQ